MPATAVRAFAVGAFLALAAAITYAATPGSGASVGPGSHLSSAYAINAAWNAQTPTGNIIQGWGSPGAGRVAGLHSNFINNPPGNIGTVTITVVRQPGGTVICTLTLDCLTLPGAPFTSVACGGLPVFNTERLSIRYTSTCALGTAGYVTLNVRQ